MPPSQYRAPRPLESGSQPSAAAVTDCGEASGSYGGVAWADAEAPNAALRMVLDDGRRVQDFFLFAE